VRRLLIQAPKAAASGTASGRGIRRVVSQQRKIELMKRGGIDPISMDRRPLSQILDDHIPYERWEQEKK
jgi:hypothetical protein